MNDLASVPVALSYFKCLRTTGPNCSRSRYKIGGHQNDE